MRDDTKRASRRAMTVAAAARAVGAATLLVVVLAQSGCVVLAGAGAAGALAGGAVGAAVVGDEPQGGTALVGAAVAVNIDRPRDLVLAGAAGGDGARLHDVRFVLGRVTAVRADTLWLAVTEARGAAGSESFAAIAGPVAAVVGGPGVSVRVVARDASRATSAYVGAAIGAVAAIAGLLGWCAQTRCLD